jgi:hypothetical protein
MRKTTPVGAILPFPIGLLSTGKDNTMFFIVMQSAIITSQ